MLAGFSSLPSGVQATILSLVWKATSPYCVDALDGLALVSHAFEANHFLTSSNVTNVTVTTYSMHEHACRQVAQLPYMPLLQTFGGSEPSSRFLASLINAPHLPFPPLASLHLALESRDLPAAASALASLAQLTALRLTASNSPGHQLPVAPALRMCRRLRDLTLILSVPRLLDLSHLTCLHSLTHLNVWEQSSHQVRPGQHGADTLLPVADALPHLTSLQSLHLQGLRVDQHAEPCWQALAHGLPTLPHLTALFLRIGCHPSGSAATCLHTLSMGLSRLTALRSLAFFGGHPYDVTRDTAQRAASEELARGIGALTGLEPLELSCLEGCVSAHDCYAHLRRLTALRSLSITGVGDWLPLAWQGDGGDAMVDMLSGSSGMLSCMTRLTCLTLTSSHMLPERGATALLTVAVPVLAGLQFLEVLGEGEHLRRVPFKRLAAKMRAGHLAALHRVCVDLPDEVLSDLNRLAQRAGVFSVLGRF